MTRALYVAALILVISPRARCADPLRPVIEGDWWQVAGDPDLGEYTSPRQQPVDFGVWQAADGTWQLWSCIRHTKCGGNTRLFYRWEGKSLTDSDWTPMGIAMEADPSLGESKGGLQAPHVIREDGTYYMFYGDWTRICLARSDDGKSFTRVLNSRGQPDLFSGPYENSRDPMVLKIGELYYCYYMGHKKDVEHQSAIFCRTSHDLTAWSEPMLVSAGGVAVKQTNWYGGDAECPFVVEKDGLFHLFRNQLYGEKNLNTQYVSPNPLSFGVGDDRYRTGTLAVAAPEIIHQDGQDYIAALLPSLKGIRIAKLAWRARDRRDPDTWTWNDPRDTGIPGVRHGTIDSKANGRTIGYNVYLPPGYDASDERYPVVYFLHGAGGTEKSDTGLARLVDAEIRAERIPPVIWVFPNGGHFSGYRDREDGSVRAETLIMEELIPRIDSEFRTIADRRGRALCGFSMGGGGSLRLALQHPERFCAAASLAAAVGGRPRRGEAGSTRSEDDASAFARKNVELIRGKVALKLVIGEEDFLFPRHEPFLKTLKELGIEYDFTPHPGVGHNLGKLTELSGVETVRFLAKSLDRE